MGTDIHLVAEVYVDDEWHYVPGPIIACRACEGTGERGGRDCYWCNPPTASIWHEDTQTEEEFTDPFRNVCPGKYRDEWYSERGYNAFAILGNVRNGVGFAGVVTGEGFTPISDGRGFPHDLCEESKRWFELHGGDHSASWVGLDEVMRYPWDDTVRLFTGRHWWDRDGEHREGGFEPFVIREVVGDFLNRMKMLAMEVGAHPCRLVFDFDS